MNIFKKIFKRKSENWKCLVCGSYDTLQSADNAFEKEWECNHCHVITGYKDFEDSIVTIWQNQIIFPRKNEYKLNELYKEGFFDFVENISTMSLFRQIKMIENKEFELYRILR